MSCAADPLDPFFEAVRAAPAVSADRLAELARAAAGSVEARNEMVALHLPLVISMARRLAGSAELGDLISEGGLGLLDAAARFDPARGVRFGTYAWPWIRKRMFAAVRAAGSARATEHARRLLAAEEKAHAALAQTLGREPTSDELAEHLGRSEQRAATATAARMLRARGSEADLGALAADGDLDEALDHRRQIERLRADLDDFAPAGTRVRQVVERVLADESFDDIANEVGLSARRCREIYAAVVERLRRDPGDPQLRLFGA